MKRWLIFSCLLLGNALQNCSAATADVHLHGLSARFQPGTATANALNYRLELSTGSPADPVLNGELAPLPANVGASHGSFYVLTGDVLFEPVFGSLAVDIPQMTDSDTNGVPDFFEITRAVPSSTTTGVFEDLEQSGKVTAVWSRPANSKDGTCTLTFDTRNLTFTHQFEIIEFAGPLTYSSTETNITGSVALTQVMEPTRTLSGPLNMLKISTDTLHAQDGAWRNDAGLNLSYQVPDDLARAEQRFASKLFFQDGDPATPAEDYLFWVLAIVDTADSNGNGVPDLSDTGAIVRRPMLAITRGGRTNVFLHISGEVGKQHRIEQTSVLDGSWVPATSFVLTNDPQTVSVRVTTNRPAFWQVLVP